MNANTDIRNIEPFLMPARRDKHARAVHTPGPWISGDCIASIPKTIDIGATDGSNVALVLTGDNVASDAVAWANLRLIRAAPELLQQLRQMTELLERETSLKPDDRPGAARNCRAILAARRTIGLATGAPVPGNPKYDNEWMPA